YPIAGSFLGLRSASEGHLQLCPSSYRARNMAFTFGTNFKQKCQVLVDDLYKTSLYQPLYFDAFVQYEVERQTLLYAVPLLITNIQSWKDDYSKKYDDVSSWILTRRFFMVDNIIGRMEDSSDHHVMYVQSLKIFTSLQKDTTTGLIYPPYIELTYASVSKKDSGKSVEVFFSSIYSMDMTRHERDMWISLGVMMVVAFIATIIDTWSWSNRSGQVSINCLTLVQCFFIMSGHLANAIFIVLVPSSVWIFIFYKNQKQVSILPHDGLHNEQFLSFLICACLLKLLHVIHLIFTQVNVDIFLVDWEKPTKIETNQQQQRQLQQQQQLTPSVWRMYLVANEWNEIQTFRKTNTIVQFILVVFFLEVVGLGYLSTMDPFNKLRNSNYNNNANNDDAENIFIVHSHLFRFAWICIVYLTVGICQIIFVLLIYERFFEDKIRQFVDLCSTCNISMFIFSSDLYGYYIHGRSVHGRSDVGLRQMHENFAREEKDIVSKRGLLPDDEEQTFEIIVSNKLRNNIDRITKPVLYSQNNRTSAIGGIDKEIEQSVEAHYVMNQTLMAYIDHTLTDVDYIVKKKSLLEALLNFEFQFQTFLGTFYRDNGHSFDCVLFYGHEMTLMMFEVLLMTCMDLIFTNYVLDAIITYVLMEIVLRSFRDSFGRSNLARKTMVDKRFLI
ncbi:hypothetical protein HELRODRAFT_70743, partial [Helobdella robusta]|uniref:Meckelin n=1 Tax=Helobdella robusta TaxID=6412 RepID=T1G0B6_HELRO